MLRQVTILIKLRKLRFRSRWDQLAFIVKELSEPEDITIMTSGIALIRVGAAAVREITRLCRMVIRAFRLFGGMARIDGISLWGSRSLTLPFALGLVLISHCANANGNMVDSFTYNGTQSGFTQGSVYALSIANTELNVCLFTPSGTTPNVQYAPSCQNTLAPSDSNGYSAIAYLGTVNNPNNYFAVGDNAGNIYLMQIQFNSGNPNPISVKIMYSYYLGNPDVSGQPCGQIANLAVDPNGQFLYIGCNVANNSGYQNQFIISGYTTYIGPSSGALLGVAPINTGGTLGSITTIPPITPAAANGKWVNSASTTGAVSNYTAEIFGVSNGGTVASNLANQVNPKMRVYPPGFPGLTGTAYASTGGVFYSGLISGFNNNYVAINSGIMCSNGSCQVAYNYLRGTSQSSFGVITAAEYAIENNGSPVLNWNQISGAVVPTLGNFYDTGWVKNTGNVIVTCQPNALISSSTTASPCSFLNNFQWPPNSNIPSSTVWVDQIIFSPTPAAVGNNTSFTQGLLVWSTWNNSYLGYYSIAAGTYETGVFMSGNNYNGEVGANVYGLTTDPNGNLLIEAGSSGLLGFNAFPTTSSNILTQTDVTYVPIPADNSANNTCGAGCQVKQALGIISSVVSIISVANLDDDDGVANHSKLALDASGTATLLRMAGRQEHFTLIEPDSLNSDANDGDRSISIAMISDGGMFARGKSDAEPVLLQLAGFSAADRMETKRWHYLNPPAPAATLARVLGTKPYWGKFTYSEEQMKLMGARRGDWINGLQLRLGGGISALPKDNIKINSLQIGLSSDGTRGNGSNNSPYRSTVFNGSLCVSKETYSRDRNDGYGSAIWFDRPYRYLGGDLTLTMLHSGSKNPKRFYLDALLGPGVSGAYAELASVQSISGNVQKLSVAPKLKFSIGLGVGWPGVGSIGWPWAANASRRSCLQ